MAGTVGPSNGDFHQESPIVTFNGFGALAPEIAQVLLRRQQADAIMSAHAKIVTGAVSMVEMALHPLAEKQIVDLDDERRAAMVSELMTMLRAESDVQPVINIGTLYN